MTDLSSRRVTEAQRTVLDGFSSSIEPVKVSFVYTGGLMIVALAMVVLPILYLCLIGAAGYGVYYHATENDFILAQRGSTRLRTLMYFGPLIAGSAAVLFMFKPLFAPRPAPPPQITLKEEDEPTLYAFVRKLCNVIGAPPPKRIDVDNQVNASASYRSGLWSIFLRGDLVLTIGLPLVAGLPIQNLTGVLAHEFGHFAQSFGMRLSYVIRSVNGWFARVVFERDRWDQWLAQQSEMGLYRLIVFGSALLCIFLSRQVLKVLMMIGHGISCFMLRQMEYDADRYEARVAGSQAFKDTALQLQMLGFAERMTYSDLSVAWEEKRLVNRLPAMVVENRKSLPPNTEKELESAILETRTGLFDTHPADSDRIASVMANANGGLFQIQDESSILFSDFEALSEESTLSFYRHNVSASIEQKNLASTDELLARQSVRREGDEAISRFLLNVPCRTILLAEVKAGRSFEAMEGKVRASRERMSGILPDVAAFIEKQGLEAAQEAWDDDSDHPTVKKWREFETTAAERLGGALGILDHPDYPRSAASESSHKEGSIRVSQR